jgi:tRNA pseudouridine13 synthase
MPIIKQKPEDFIVTEVPSAEVKERGDYIYFWLTKKNYTTHDAVQRIVDALRVPAKRVGYAGAKDRSAVTKQLISFQRVKREKIEALKLKDIALEFYGYGDEPISLGDLTENKFEIVVRDLSEKDIKHFEHEVHGEVEIINYFDEQRFSEDNIEIGRALVKKDFRKAAQLVARGDGDYNRAVLDYLSENATDFVGGLRLVPRKILLLLLHSYQSWLWNEMVAAYVMENVSELSLRKYMYGTFAFHCERMENRKVPIVGFGTEISRDLKKFADEVLGREKISSRDFIIREIQELSAEGGERDLLVRTTGFKYTVAEDRKTVTLLFALPKGSYATIVVKRLFEIE